MNLKRIVKNLLVFAKKNYLISFFIIIAGLTGLVIFYKIFTQESQVVYVKVKVSQGLWWANAARPNWWYVQALNKGAVEKGLSGKPIAEILSVQYYSWYGRDQLDLYLTVKIEASKNETANTYSFKRSNIAVAAPIELDFGTVQVTGTIMDISDKPFSDDYVEKKITLTKRFAYPWEFNAIQIGDTYFDGEQVVFEILDKKRINGTGSYISFLNDRDSSTPLNQGEGYTIEVQGKIKLQEIEGKLFYGSEYAMQVGNELNISTTQFNFYDYFISSLE